MLVDVPDSCRPTPVKRPIPRCPRSGSRSAPPAIAARSLDAHASTRRTCWPSPRRSADYRKRQGIDGPLFLGIDTHALSQPAFASALEVLAANGVERDDRATAASTRRRRPSRTRSSPTTAAAAPGWPTASSSRRRTIRRTTAASSTTRRTAARPTPTSPAGSRSRANALLEGGLQRRAPHAVRAGAARADHARARLPRRLRRRPRQRRRHRRDPRRRRSAWASIRSAAPACTTGRGSPSATGSTSRSSATRSIRPSAS